MTKEFCIWGSTQQRTRHRRDCVGSVVSSVATAFGETWELRTRNYDEAPQNNGVVVLC